MRAGAAPPFRSWARIPGVTANVQLAAWLVSRRPEIESVMELRLGPAAPSPAAAETEVLRRFRSFAAAALRRGVPAEPALDGIRAHEKRVNALLAAWSEAAAEVAGEQAEPVRDALAPLITRFRASFKGSTETRRKRGAPRSNRRAVTAAIDRIADAFLAIDADSGVIADANPAAGALLGVDRDALLGVDALGCVPPEAHARWWIELDAITEGDQARRFETALQDCAKTPVAAECTISSFRTRNRTLALVLVRPR